MSDFKHDKYQEMKDDQEHEGNTYDIYGSEGDSDASASICMCDGDNPMHDDGDEESDDHEEQNDQEEEEEEEVDEES